MGTSRVEERRARMPGSGDDPADRPAGCAKPRLRVGFVLLRNFTLLPFAGFVDVLRLAADEGDRSRQILCRWQVMAPGRERARASCGTMVEADGGFADPRQFDYIAVVGGLLDAEPPADAATILYLRAAATCGVPLIGLCTGVFALIQADLMKNRSVCVSWYHYQDLLKAFPDVKPVADRLFVVDGPRITCAGGLGAIDLAAWLVDRHLGSALAQKAIHILLGDQARPAEAPQPHAATGVEPRDRRLRRAMALIEQSLATPPRPTEIARRVGLSRRQLERLFRAELGATPASYSLAVRLRHGHWLITRTASSATQIAHECGFADVAHFSRQMKQAFGASPRSLRGSARPFGQGGVDHPV
jgi:transcriptional regulator GlxA family with amidase domain